MWISCCLFTLWGVLPLSRSWRWWNRYVRVCGLRQKGQANKEDFRCSKHGPDLFRTPVPTEAKDFQGSVGSGSRKWWPKHAKLEPHCFLCERWAPKASNQSLCSLRHVNSGIAEHVQCFMWVKQLSSFEKVQQWRVENACSFLKVYLHPIHPLRVPGNCSHLEDIEPSKLGPLASLLKGWKVGRIRSTACLSELTNGERLKQHSQHIPKCHLLTVFTTKTPKTSNQVKVIGTEGYPKAWPSGFPWKFCGRKSASMCFLQTVAWQILVVAGWSHMWWSEHRGTLSMPLRFVKEV